MAQVEDVRMDNKIQIKAPGYTNFACQNSSPRDKIFHVLFKICFQFPICGFPFPAFSFRFSVFSFLLYQLVCHEDHCGYFFSFFCVIFKSAGANPKMDLTLCTIRRGKTTPWLVDTSYKQRCMGSAHPFTHSIQSAYSIQAWFPFELNCYCSKYFLPGSILGSPFGKKISLLFTGYSQANTKSASKILHTVIFEPL